MKNLMRKNFGNRNRKTDCQLQYSSLEDRRLLAMLISGGEGNDQVEVTHVAANIVTVKINETVMENLDISDGLRINTQGGDQDRVWIDHHITADVGVFNAEELVFSGGDNFWQIGFKVDPLPVGSLYYDPIDLPGKTAGRINNNITFLGTNTLRSGAGHDRYSINTERLYGLEIYGGDGNDLFRFSAASIESFYPSVYGRSAVTAFGQGGHDRFVLHGEARVAANGGAGFDILDYRQANYAASEVAGDVVSGIWGNGNERIIGAEGQPNQFLSRSSGADVYRFNWIIEGNRTAVSDNNHQAFVELINFTDFHADPNGLDYFWVLETGDDIRINDADWIQIASDFQAAHGNLDSINHDISILKTLPAVLIAGTDLAVQPSDTSPTMEAGLSPYARPPAIDMDGVVSPQVVISDASGNGTVARFGKDQTISGLTGGRIIFENDISGLVAIAGANVADLPYAPEIIIHGSQSADDFFLFEHTWTPVSVYSHGGDDTFMFGAANRYTDGTMDGVDGEVSIFAGAGTDRMYLNDQGLKFGTAGFKVTDRLIQDASSLPTVARNGQPKVQGLAEWKRFADIHFDGTLEVARLNGSLTTSSKFDVVPSAHTRFVFQGSENSNDRLFVNAFFENRELYESNHNGAWTFGNQAKTIHFFGIESVSDLRLVQSEANEFSPETISVDGSALTGQVKRVDNPVSFGGLQSTDDAFETL